MEVGNRKGDLEVVPVMSEVPGYCAFCGTTPMDEDNNPMPAIQVVGIDFNWGDTVYICDTCSDLICDLKDRVTQEEHEALQEKFKFVSKRLKRETAKNAKILEATKLVINGDKTREQLKKLLAKEEK